MAKLILDISANTTKNDNSIANKLIEKIKEIDSQKYEIIFKAQLFKTAGENTPMEWEHFDHIYNTCRQLGYKCTASVFDRKSLNFLLEHDIPFVKIACRDDLYWLIGHIKRSIPVYLSYNLKYPNLHIDEHLACIPKYPASKIEYEELFSEGELKNAISDHTPDMKLFLKYRPRITEIHYCLSNSTGLDADSGVCKRPADLKGVL